MSSPRLGGAAVLPLSTAFDGVRDGKGDDNNGPTAVAVDGSPLLPASTKSARQRIKAAQTPDKYEAYKERLSCRDNPGTAWHVLRAFWGLVVQWRVLVLIPYFAGVTVFVSSRKLSNDWCFTTYIELLGWVWYVVCLCFLHTCC